MAALRSKDWNTNVECKCGDTIKAYSLTYNGDRSFHYFKCYGCKIDGKWIDLARGYFEFKKRTS